MTDEVVVAARNNAHWCDAVCRSHTLATSFEPNMWAVAARSPDGYPDAVTLEGRVSAAEVMAAIDIGHGCSVKDSFADLDLTTFGLTILFEAQWIGRAPGIDTPDPALTWNIIDRSAELADWASAHGLVDAFRPELLREAGVRMLAARRAGRLVAGAALNRSESVVGISSLFCLGPDPGAVWRDVVTIAARLFPGVPLVGYESGFDLQHAVAAGFTPIGPLRVWIHGAARPA